MKHLLLLISAAALMLTACKNLDQNVVIKLKSAQEKYQGFTNAFSATANGYKDLLAQLDAQDPKLKNTLQFQEVRGFAANFQKKTNATISGYNDLQSKLGSLAADYTGGKLQPDAVQKDFDVITKGLDEHQVVLTEMAERLTTQLDKLKEMKESFVSHPEYFISGSESNGRKMPAMMDESATPSPAAPGERPAPQPGTGASPSLTPPPGGGQRH
jgi:uncharacterized protein YukE